LDGSFDDYLQIEMRSEADYSDHCADDDWKDDELEPLSLVKATVKIETKEAEQGEVSKPVAPARKKGRPKQDPFVTCPTCLKSVVRRKLKLHIMGHEGLKPHLCDECGKGFRWKFSLAAHKRVHSGEKPYHCKECNQNFRSSSRYSEHTTIHTGKRAYICDRCSLAFRTSGRLKRHMRTHTGDRPFSCTYCEKRFSENYNLRQHLRLHTNEGPKHVCPICSLAYIRRKMLTDHMTSLHPGAPLPPPLAPAPVINTNLQNPRL